MESTGRVQVGVDTVTALRTLRVVPQDLPHQPVGGDVGRRGRRGRRTKLGDFAVLVVAFAIGYAFLWQRVWPPFLVLLGLSVVGAWWCFVMPTYCDHITNAGRQCSLQVNGKLRGCRWHCVEKNDAVFAMFSLTNPGRMFRLAWQGRDVEYRAGAAHPGSGPTRRDAYDGIMIVATVGSFVVGAAGSVFSGLALV